MKGEPQKPKRMVKGVKTPALSTVAQPQEGEGLDRLKSDFVSVVSHEFRTPLGVILSAAEVLEAYFDRLTPDRRGQYLEDIKDAARTMTRLMDEVLFLERAESGRTQLRPTATDLADFCKQIAAEVTTSLNQRCAIQIKAKGRVPVANADPMLLRHALINLLSNAVKYSKPGDEVVCEILRQGTQAIIKVVDKGIGIPAADQAHLFEMFHRAGNVGQIPGTGLGLVIVRRCIELHQGKVSFTSVEGSGSTFTLELPAFAPAAS